MNRHDRNFYSRLARGHPSAFEDVLTWYADDVLRFAAFLLNDSEEAKDVLQETMMKFVESVKKKRIHMNNGSIKPLLMTITRNLCINSLKKNKRFVEYPDGCINNVANLTDTHTPLLSVKEMEFEEAFHKALDHLSPIQRTVLILHELQDDSFHEIATSLGISYEATKKNFYRGLKKLRILLEPYNR